MSPNEEQLRAALRQGEGERPDADLIISCAREARRSRRRVAWAIAGSAAVVIAIGGGITALSLQHSGNNSTSSGAAAGAPAPSPTSAAGLAAPASRIPGAEAAPEASAAQGCPGTPPTIPMPNASTGRLFPDGITAVRICLYQVGTPKFAGTNELTGTAAEQLARRLEDSPLPTPTTPCTTDLGPSVVILASTAKANTATVVGNLGGCGEITNGQAVRLARAVLQDEARVILRQPGPPGVNSHGPGPS